MAKRFEELDCWKSAVSLDKEVYKLIKKSGAVFDYALMNQMLRSVGSVADNIAEGFERGGTKELIHYLFIAKGSCGELRSQFHRAKERQIITDETFRIFLPLCSITSGQIMNFITYLKKTPIEGQKFKIG
jgi:four helix bundle protein